MQFSVEDMVKELKQDKERWYEFLKVLAVNYRYELDQNLMLFKQGYSAIEELAGWEYIKYHRLEDNRKYICTVGGKAVYLFPLERKSELSERKSTSAFIMNFMSYTGIAVSDKSDQEGFVLNSTSLVVNASNYEEIIKAAITIKTLNCTSIFTKDVVTYLLLGEGDAYSMIERMDWKDVYKLLMESFVLYREMVYGLVERFFTVEEILLLNQSYQCEYQESMIKKLQEQGADTELILKVQELDSKEKTRLLRAIKTERLTRYPVYRF